MIEDLEIIKLITAQFQSVCLPMWHYRYLRKFGIIKYEDRKAWLNNCQIGVHLDQSFKRHIKVSTRYLWDKDFNPQKDWSSFFKIADAEKMLKLKSFW